MSLNNSTQHIKAQPLPTNEKSYLEIVTYLNNNWKKSSFKIIVAINQSLGNIASNLYSIIIAGTNGKSSTIYYLEELSKAKNITIATFSSPHSISYNERFKINGNIISNETFTDAANQVLYATDLLQIHPSSKDLLTAMAIILFNDHKVDIAVFEREDMVNRDPVTICSPMILGIPRIIEKPSSQETYPIIEAVINHISNKTHVISSDQSKPTLKRLEEQTKKENGVWVMPTRKLAPLVYPFEQLFGRHAALADRIIQTYLDTNKSSQTIQLSPDISKENNISLFKSKLTTPTKIKTTANDLTKDKKIKNLHLSSIGFWQSINNQVPNKLEILNKKNGITVVLDNADNLDSFNDLFLGIRLLNHKHSFKSISFVVGSIQGQCDEAAFVRLLKIYFKKNLELISFCSISNKLGEKTGCSWDIKLLVDISNYAKLKVIVHSSLDLAIKEMSSILSNSLPESTINFLNNTNPLNEKLIVITGSQAIVSEYHKLMLLDKSL